MPPQGSSPLPEELVNQLQSFRKLLRFNKLLELSLLLLIIIAFCAIIFIVSDRLWDTPTSIQYALSLFSLASIFILTPIWAYVWVWNKRKLEQLAKLIGKGKKSLGDDLLGVIELERQNSDNTSEDLKKAAMKQIAAQVNQINLNAFIPRKFITIIWVSFLSLVGIMIVFVILMGESTLNSIQRFTQPFNQVERFTYTRFDDLQPHYIIPMGEQSLLTLRLDEASQNKPAGISYRLNDNEWLYSPLSPHSTYTITLPPLQESSTLKLHAGDYVTEIAIRPEPRPAFIRGQAQVTYPSYLNKPQEKQALRAGNLQVVQGAEADLILQTNHAILSAQFCDKQGTPLNIPHTIEGDQVTLHHIKVDKDHQEIRVKFTDTNQLTSARPVTLKIQGIKDKNPNFKLSHQQSYNYLLEDQPIIFDLVGSDDFGLKNLGIEWLEYADPATKSDAILLPSKQILAEGSPNQQELKEQFSFTPKNYGFASTTLQFRTFGSDHQPGAEIHYSNPIVLTVVTLSEHVEMVKKNIEMLRLELDDITRNLYNIADKSNELLELSEEEISQEDKLEKLKELAQEEAFAQNQTKALANRMKDVFDDASRNNQINKDTLQTLLSATNKTKGVAKGEMNAAQTNYNKASQNESSNSQRKELQKTAHEDNSKAITKIQDIANQLNLAAEQMEGDSFMARLNMLATVQEKITNTIKNKIDYLVAETTIKLTPSLQAYISDIKNLQKDNTDQLSWIIEELSFYVNKPNREIHKNVYQEMKSSDISENMLALGLKIEQNHTLNSIDLSTEYAKLFKKWSKMFNKKKDENQGGGGGGSQNQEELSEEEFEVLLQIIRLIQKQQELRIETRQIEKLQREATKNIPVPTPS